MKRIAEQSGSGGRLRLGLLMASVAAFLLVPVAAASAAEAEIVFAGSGSGTITGGEPVPGEPPLDCFGNAGAAEGPICTTETQPLEGLDAIKVEREAAPGSKFAGFKVIAGQNLGTCAVESFETTECAVLSFGEKIIIEATFELEPNVHIEIDGEGSGSVTGVPSFVGEPPVDCTWDGEAEAQSGDCDVLANEAGGFTGINVKQEAAPGSEFAGWTLEKGFEVEEGCEPFGATCGGLILGPQTEVVIKAKFDLFLEPYPLNLTTSGSGEGSFECNIGGEGFGACPSEVKETESVEVKVVPNTGSELTEWTSGPCEGTTDNPCSFTMPSEEVSANAQVDLETFTLTTEAFGAGEVTAPGITCTEAGNGGAECEETFTYGTNVVVTATPEALNSVGSLTGSGSASVCSNEAGPEEAATCEFGIKADSEVTAEFVAAASIATDPGNVKGTVDQQTTLATENCDEVDLGPFVPSNEAVKYTNDECVVTVTATGTENELRAADEQPSQGATDETGHLTQEPEDPFTLNKALEVRGTGTTGGAAPSGYLPLSSTALIQDYGTPVSLDVVTVGFRQIIQAFEPLHTGTYDKTITLTLEQNVL